MQAAIFTWTSTLHKGHTCLQSFHLDHNLNLRNIFAYLQNLDCFVNVEDEYNQRVWFSMRKWKIFLKVAKLVKVAGQFNREAVTPSARSDQLFMILIKKGGLLQTATVAVQANKLDAFLCDRKNTMFIQNYAHKSLDSNASFGTIIAKLFQIPRVSSCFF